MIQALGEGWGLVAVGVLAAPWLEKITVAHQPFGGLHQPFNQLLAVCAGLFFTSLWRFAGLFFTSPWRFASAS